MVEYDHVVEQRLYIVNLMSRDDEGAVGSHVAGYHTAEETLGRDVQTIGRLVHQQQARAGGKGKTHIYLLLLSHGQLAEIGVAIELKFSKTLVQYFL